MSVQIKRNIARDIERDLWARAAGRCQFSGCNRLLYRSPVTQEAVNIAEKAHIYSFSKDGPRGHGPLRKNKAKLNGIANLILACHDCHKKIDKDKDGRKYSARLLMQCKEDHERRVELVTGICSDKKSHVVIYEAKIGEQPSRVQYENAVEAMFPCRYPAEERPIDLSMTCEHEDRTAEFWQTESRNLKAAFERNVFPRIKDKRCGHFSVFGFAPQPLLILLGALLTDKVDAETYQLHREPKTWKWQNHPDGFQFVVRRPKNTRHVPALVVSLSDKVSPKRIESALGRSVSIWELSISEPGNGFLRSQAQLSMFRDEVRKLMVAIKEKHGHKTPLSIFPVMPVACAIELGRVRMPKAEMPWIIYDQNSKEGGFIEALRIPGDCHGK